MPQSDLRLGPGDRPLLPGLGTIRCAGRTGARL